MQVEKAVSLSAATRSPNRVRTTTATERNELSDRRQDPLEELTVNASAPTTTSAPTFQDVACPNGGELSREQYLTGMGAVHTLEDRIALRRRREATISPPVVVSTSR